MDLEAYIKSYPPADPSMHLTHCAPGHSAIKMLESQTLKASLCRVYGVDLLYMFYGRPAYKTSVGILPNGMLELAPVCLILDPKMVRQAVRIMPFDSGGYKHYKDILGVKFTLSEFELGNRRITPPRMVGAFFDNNRNYYDQNYLAKNDGIPLAGLTARAYTRLIKDQTVRSYDDRGSTIEIQFDKDVPLKPVLRAIVAPTAFFDDPSVKKALRPFNKVVPVPYKMYGRNEPSGFAYALYDYVDRYLTNEGVIT